MLLICVSANARTCLGGNAFFGGAGYETDQASKLEKTIRLYPTIGFTVGDKWECGISTGYGHLRNIGGLEIGRMSFSIAYQF